jgi:hypothetical protein
MLSPLSRQLIVCQRVRVSEICHGLKGVYEVSHGGDGLALFAFHGSSHVGPWSRPDGQPARRRVLRGEQGNGEAQHQIIVGAFP